MNKDLLRKLFFPFSILNKLIRKDEKRIFFYSNLGFRDNVRAVYDYMIDNGYNDRYQIICAINEWEEYRKQQDDDASRHKGVTFVSPKKGIIKFLKAKYAFYSFGKYPIKPSKNQIVVNLWHGMPLKRIGNMEKGKEKIDYNYFTYLISTSDYFTNIMMESFSCSKEQILINGEPRNDIMFVEDIEIDSILREGADKFILWLPTYRDSTEGGSEAANNDSPLHLIEGDKGNEIDSFLRANNMILFIKHHPLQREMYNSSFTNIRILSHKEFQDAGGSLYDYLRCADALITDYSSVYFDYMLLDRPIAFVLDDIDKYGSNRGFVIENPLDMMPGANIHTEDELLDFIVAISEGRDEHRELRHEINNLVNKYQDGNSTKHLLDRIMRNEGKA